MFPIHCERSDEDDRTLISRSTYKGTFREHIITIDVFLDKSVWDG